MKKILPIIFLLFFILSLAAVSMLPDKGGREIDSPSNRIKESQISIYDNKVVLDIKGARWAGFTDTNSMDPVIDEGAHSIEILPDSEKDIQAGDIISYKDGKDIIIHRVLYKGDDENGAYFITKGDNNDAADPIKVRFEDIKGVVVAVIY